MIEVYTQVGREKKRTNFCWVSNSGVVTSGRSRGVPLVPWNPPFCRFVRKCRRPRAHVRAQSKTFWIAEPHFQNPRSTTGDCDVALLYYTSCSFRASSLQLCTTMISCHRNKMLLLRNKEIISANSLWGYSDG